MDQGGYEVELMPTLHNDFYHEGWITDVVLPSIFTL